MLIRWLWLLFVAAITLMFTLFGRWVGESLGARLFVVEDGGVAAGPDVTYFQVGVILLFALVGFLVSLFLFRKLIGWLQHMEAVPLLDNGSNGRGGGGADHRLCWRRAFKR